MTQAIGVVLLILAVPMVALVWRLARKLHRLLKTSREGAVRLGESAVVEFGVPGKRDVYLEQPIGTQLAQVTAVHVVGPDRDPVPTTLERYQMGPVILRPVTTSLSRARVCIGSVHPSQPGRHEVTSETDAAGEQASLVFYRPYGGSMALLIVGLVLASLALIVALSFGLWTVLS